MFFRWLLYCLLVVLGFGLLGAGLVGLAVVLTYPNLPSLESLTDYRPKIPLRVYTADGDLIGEFGEERRALVKVQDVPKPLIQAILAAEDERFYEHGGVDYRGVLRAVYYDLVAGGARQGASTITMQVARNFFLSREKKWTRKFNEVLLAFKIESSLSKDQILELYINQIFLGQRVYGFSAAAQTYFNKPLNQLNLGEIATLAGLPTAPSRDNPLVNPRRARLRELHVLGRMRDLKYITEEQYAEAIKLPVRTHREIQEYPVKADYVAEMVRQIMYERYQDDTYTKGFQVYTTIRKDLQEGAYQAVRRGLLEYDKRHGYRGPEGIFDIPADASRVEETLEDSLQDVPDSDDMLAAVVLEVSPKRVTAYRRGGESVEISGDGLKFAQKALADKAPESLRIRRGALIRIMQDARGGWQITQLPQAEACLVAMDPADGAVRALVGGFDFNRNKFNHVIQAWRQPGSGFKPFIYSSALEKGFTAASIINDAPIFLDATQTGSEPWEPKDYEGEFEGPMRLRMALAKSKNLVSIRVLQAITPQYAQDYVTRFGFDADKQPPFLTLALGVGSVTPLQMVTGFAAFANGGYRVTPYYIESIKGERGLLLAAAKPDRAGETAPRVIDERNAFIIQSMMQDVIRQGTGARAMQLGRHDLAGKTGTTNDFVDAWFNGFQRTLVASAWVGFDKPHSLGHNETGAQAALPIWISFMAKALKGVPEALLQVPEGVVAVKIDPDSGLKEPDDAKGGVVEYFYKENVPAEAGAAPASQPAKSSEEVKNQLF